MQPVDPRLRAEVKKREWAARLHELDQRDRRRQQIARRQTRNRVGELVLLSVTAIIVGGAIGAGVAWLLSIDGGGFPRGKPAARRRR